MKRTETTKEPPAISHPRGESLDASCVTGMDQVLCCCSCVGDGWGEGDGGLGSDLRLEDARGRFHGLVAQLRGELHRQLCVLHGHYGALRVTDGSSGQRLCGAIAALLGLLERGNGICERAAEAITRAGP